MAKRIKFVYLLTIITSIALIAAQVYWLVSQYEYSLQQRETELFAKTVEAAETDRAVRNRISERKLYAITRTDIKVRQDIDEYEKSSLDWSFDIYLINNEMQDMPATVGYDSLFVDSLYRTGKEISRHQFEIRAPDRQHDVYEALGRFIANQKCAFTTERFDSLLNAEGVTPDAVIIETADSTVWDASRRSHASLLKPKLEVSYPFDILQRQQVVVVYNLSAMNAIRSMLLPFGCSLVLSFLLIFCLLYQTKTIFRQHRIEVMRKDFIQTMIHELKRPITTLKFFLSFITNEQLQKDSVLKDEMIRNSHNELDNLSSYFSKLRDVMYADDIPLNVTSFNLKRMVEGCIEKISIPTDKTVNMEVMFENDDFEVTADKMHLGNVVCNLLENAVKYSHKALKIRIDCKQFGDKYQLTVTDNGIGIPEAERNHVFDRFFRGKDVENTDIPGIGLGLSYVRLLVQAHGGTVALESEQGKGTKFIIILPVKQ